MDNPLSLYRAKNIPKGGRFCRPLPPVAAEGELAVGKISFRHLSESMNTKDMTMKRSTTAKAFTIVALTALALGIAPTANAYDKECSNASLKGTFAEKDGGFLTNPSPAPASLFAGVILDAFDGNGTITASGFVSIDGTVSPQTENGTYTVNSDCTGTYEVQVSPGGFTAHAFFVIDDGGNELQIIPTDAGTVVTCIARKQFPESHWER